MSIYYKMACKLGRMFCKLEQTFSTGECTCFKCPYRNNYVHDGMLDSKCVPCNLKKTSVIIIDTHVSSVRT